uniref:Uncharacterized protein n=1 Tax=Solanum lycopersicum TaxID=4081 RepID=A0A3Q7ES50_SOLLC
MYIGDLIESSLQILVEASKIGLLVKILVIKSHHFWLDAEHLQETIQNTLSASLLKTSIARTLVTPPVLVTHLV